MRSGLRVLVVEDEVISSMLLEHQLAELGCEIAGSAATGAEALELARSAPPDFATMDVGLAGPMDGIEAADQIQKRRLAGARRPHQRQELTPRYFQVQPR